jgi:hypothetical protein
MRLSPCLLVTLLALAFVPARADAAATSPPGVNLRWDNCYGDGGAWNKNFGCDTNLGSERLVGSFELDQPLTQTGGVEITLDLSAAAPILPAWWVLSGAGGCRVATPPILTVNPTIPATAVNCTDWAGGAAAGGLETYAIGQAAPNTARIRGGFAVAASNLADLEPRQEYFAFTVVINHARTVGTGSCGGCDVPTCLFLQEILLETPPVVGQPSRDVRLTRGANFSGSQFATWQNGYLVDIQRSCREVVPGFPICRSSFDCVLATPTHTNGSTWGQVKSLYR